MKNLIPYIYSLNIINPKEITDHTKDVSESVLILQSFPVKHSLGILFSPVRLSQRMCSINYHF